MRRTCRATAGALVLTLLAAFGAAGCEGGVETRQRLANLENGQQALLKEVKEIKTFMQGRGAGAPQAAAQPQAPQPVSAPQNLEVALDNAAIHGKADAKLTLVEFTDFQCPFCARYAHDAYAQIERDYVATGKLRYALRHFPLERIHPQAFKAAVAAECARQQGKFWEMHTQLFANQQQLAETDLVRHASAIGLNAARFQQCLAGPASAAVRQDIDAGMRATITGTPTFFIGVAGPDGKIRVLRRISGALPYATFKSTLDELLSSPDAAR